MTAVCTKHIRSGYATFCNRRIAVTQSILLNDGNGSVATGRVEGHQTFGLLRRQSAADALD